MDSGSFRQMWLGESGGVGWGPQQAGRQHLLALGLAHGAGPGKEARDSSQGGAEAAALTCSPGCPAGPG